MFSLPDLSRLVNRLLRPRARKPNGSLRGHQLLRLEALEDRYLLSGNVSAFVSGSDLFVFGDALGNTVNISKANGNIVVQGTDNTTINGSSKPLIGFSGTDRIGGNLFVFLRQGDDQLRVAAGLTIHHSAFVFAEEGNDSVGLDQVTIEDNLILFAAGGHDQIALRNTRILGDAVLFGEGGNDTLSSVGARIGQHLLFFGGEGDNAIALEETTVIRNALLITGAGDDAISMRNSAVGDELITLTGSGNDFLNVDPTTVGDHTLVDLGAGNDAAVLTGGNVFSDHALLIGGTGTDSIEVASANQFPAGRQSILVESDAVSDSLVETRLNDPLSGVLTKSNAAQQLFVPGLTINTDANPTLPSSATLLTKQQAFTLSGTTAPGATVEIARDGDAVFDDASVVADESGKYVASVQLVHDDANRGANHLQVRATDRADRQVTESLDVHYALGTVVRFDGSLGRIDVELLDDDAPLTVANFLNYQLRYADSIVHRSAHSVSGGDFVIQGGGFVLDGAKLEGIVTDLPVTNEALAKNANLRGSLALALPGDNVNGGTSEWFINMSDDNTFLDAKPFTVFGWVIGSGMEVADAIHALDDFNLTAATGETALTNVPLAGYTEFSQALTGTVSVTQGSDVVTGTGTSFTTEILADKRMQVAGQILNVAEIVSDTELKLILPSAATQADAVANVNAEPARRNYVIFSSISELNINP